MNAMVDLDRGDAADSALLSIRSTVFADAGTRGGDQAHIVRQGRTVIVQNLTIFPGTLTPWRAIVWGLRRAIPFALRGRRALTHTPDYRAAASGGHHQWIT